MTMQKALHPRDNVDRIYNSKNRGRKKTCQHRRKHWHIDTTTRRLHKKKNERGLIMAIRNNTDNTINNRMTITRKQKGEGKKIYGRFKRLINNNSYNKTWPWLRKGNINSETESLLMAAQNNAIRTNHIKARIDKTQQNRKCGLYGDRDETINHIISGCSKLAQKNYKTRNDWVGRWSTGKCARNIPRKWLT